MATNWKRREQLLLQEVSDMMGDFIDQVREAFLNPEPGWADQAMCRGMDVEWAQPLGVKSAKARQEWMRHKWAICSQCPVQAQCAAEEYRWDDWNAIAANKAAGSVRGGMMPGHRYVTREFVMSESSEVAA